MSVRPRHCLKMGTLEETLAGFSSKQKSQFQEAKLCRDGMSSDVLARMHNYRM